VGLLAGGTTINTRNLDKVSDFITRFPVWLFASFLTAVLTCGIAATQSVMAASEGRPATGTFAAINHLPDIPLVDQSGRDVSLSLLKGKPVLIGFIHASCEGPCEMMTAKMKTIAAALEPSFSSKVTMVSVTTDPKEDHPPQLAAYAKAQGAEGEGWVFLTGKPADVAHVLNLYGVPAGDDDAMSHVFDLYLIAPDGRELRRYHGPEIKPAAVAADIQTARTKREQ
jgi:cytochrome oxidase Cu insertion factor (SCO1/SenC/PrrC family)